MLGHPLFEPPVQDGSPKHREARQSTPPAPALSLRLEPCAYSSYPSGSPQRSITTSTNSTSNQAWKASGLSTTLRLDPLELIHRLTLQIPDARHHLVRYSGAYANRVRKLYRAAEGEERGSGGTATPAGPPDLRDEEMHRQLSGDGEHNAIVCELLSMKPGRVGKDGAQVAMARLRFTIHGRSYELDVPVTLHFTRRRLLHIKGEVMLRMSDFDIHPKAKLGVIKVADEVNIWWDLYAEVDRVKR